LAIVVGLILLERRGRKRQRYANTQRMRPIEARPLTGAAASIAIFLGWFPIVIGFVAPALYLLNETIKHFHNVGSVSSQLLDSGFNTVRIAAIATLVVVVGGLVVTWAARSVRSNSPYHPSRISARLATTGYALPGTVLAIGLLLPLNAIDDLLSWVIGLFS